MKIRRRRFLGLAAAAAAVPALPRLAGAATYPSRPIHLIIGYPPGGSADMTARLFGQWLEEATRSEPNDPNAMSVATVDGSGMPDVRMVLLKGFDDQGAVFYTNMDSQKGRELAANPKAALPLLVSAAAANHPIAQYELGQMYETGQDGLVPRNLETARSLYAAAASHGMKEAQARLDQLGPAPVPDAAPAPVPPAPPPISAH